MSAAAWTSLFAPRFGETVGYTVLLAAGIAGPVLAIASLFGWTATTCVLSVVWAVTILAVLWTTVL